MAKRKGIGGPNTPEGKQASSQNATKHFCCSTKLLVPGESAEEYESFWKMWIVRYHADCDHDLFLIRTVVDAAWRMQRSERALANCEAKLYAQQPDSSLWTEEQHKQLQRFQRYKTADTNAFQKAVRFVESLRKSEKQDTLLNDRVACQVIETMCQPEALREAKLKLNTRLQDGITLPTNREDGGCTCPPCLIKWGIAEYEKTKSVPTNS